MNSGASALKAALRHRCLLTLVVASLGVLATNSATHAAGTRMVRHYFGSSSRFDKLTAQRISGHKIINDTVPFGHAPWMVSIQSSASDHPKRHVCGGVILAKRWILTASRCIEILEGMAGAKIVIQAGLVNLDFNPPGRPRSEREVGRMLKMEGCDASDCIGLLFLKEPLDLRNFFLEHKTYIRSIKLLRGRTEAFERAATLGWGQMADGSWPLSLQSLELEIKDKDVCRKACPKCMKNYTICAKGWDGFYTTRGDEGGPLIVEFNDEVKLAGILTQTSQGLSYYADVSRDVLRNWIMKMIRE